MLARAVLLLWIFVCSAWFTGCQSRVERLPAPVEVLEQPGTLARSQEGSKQPALVEPRSLIIEWPEKLRVSDQSEIILSVTVEERNSLTPAQEQSGKPIDGSSAESPNIYDTHNLVAVARLEMPGLDASREDVREALRPGRTVHFQWNVRASEAQVYRGTLWLHMELVPKDGGQVEEILLLARPMEIEAVNVLGLPANAARMIGLAGIFGSIILAYPFLSRFYADRGQNREAKIAREGRR